jgi:curved DNA-binding protein CbpA
MSVPDPYKILQVDPEAEAEVIEAAYRRLARKYHPDVAPGPDSQVRMVAINQAWEQLRDPIRRAAVDRARARDAGAAARAAAADVHVRRTGFRPSEPRAPDADQASPPPPRPSSRPGAPGGPSPEWPIPGMRDPSDGETATRRPETVSRDWTSGRSTTGSGYDPSTMRSADGDGAAGPPPGRPSGSVLSFGRYSGWSLGEIARTDLEYLEWLDRMPIGRMYQHEIDGYLRTAGRRRSAPAEKSDRRGLFRRR